MLTRFEYSLIYAVLGGDELDEKQKARQIANMNHDVLVFEYAPLIWRDYFDQIRLFRNVSTELPPKYKRQTSGHMT